MDNDIANRMVIFPVFNTLLSGGFNADIDVNLKKAESRTLMQIRYTEGRPMSFYCSKVNLEHGSFTYLADKLETKGLINRVSVVGDRRKKILMLTDKGRTLSDTIHKQLTKHMTDVVNILDEEEINELYQVVDTLERLRVSLLKKTVK
jgi:DNA-binding MarR family transcriptional regulator